jgi:hypothetical protein
MLSLTMILTGCGGATAEAIREAARAKGVATAGVERVRQPGECKQEYGLLPRSEVVGQEPLIIVDRYEDFITGTVNPTKRRCWQFNENIHSGRAGR